MVLLRYLWTVICAVLIATGAAAGEYKKVGDRVSFRPEKFIPPVTSIIWKQINTAGTVVKAIEWDEGEILIPNQRFREVTEVDEKTGQINIKNLKVEHSGVYTIDINSKEQQQRFNLTVEEGVTKPVITIEPSANPDVVYLACKYSETIIWNNSAGEKPEISKLHPGESITVKKNEGNKDNVYTCTLKNRVSEETSDPVNKNKLFKEESNAAVIVGVIFGVLIIISIIILIVLYFVLESFHKCVNKRCPCIEDTVVTNGAQLQSVTKQADAEGQSTNDIDAKGKGMKDDNESKETVPLKQDNEDQQQQQQQQ